MNGRGRSWPEVEELEHLWVREAERLNGAQESGEGLGVVHARRPRIEEDERLRE